MRKILSTALILLGSFNSGAATAESYAQPEFLLIDCVAKVQDADALVTASVDFLATTDQLPHDVRFLNDIFGRLLRKSMDEYFKATMADLESMRGVSDPMELSMAQTNR